MVNATVVKQCTASNTAILFYTQNQSAEPILQLKFQSLGLKLN